MERRSRRAAQGRYLADPPQRDQPDHYDDYVVTSSDDGGVHTNGGILSKATWLLFAGGTHPKSHIPVQPIELLKPQKLWYSVEFHDITRSSRMYSFCGYAIQRATRWAQEGTYGFTATDVCQVNNACAAVSRRFQMDLDCNGLPDGADSDMDLVVDDRDNCPEVQNPLQEDLDGDFVGDACDPDDDGDAREDSLDNCPRLVNPEQFDEDGNGLGYACDNGERTTALLDRWNAGFDVMVALVERNGILPRIPLAVVDQFGKVVAKAQVTPNPDQTVTYSLTFSPRMDLDRVLPGSTHGASLGSCYYLQFGTGGQLPGELGGTLSLTEQLRP